MQDNSMMNGSEGADEEALFLPDLAERMVMMLEVILHSSDNKSALQELERVIEVIGDASDEDEQSDDEAAYAALAALIDPLLSDYGRNHDLTAFDAIPAGDDEGAWFRRRFKLLHFYETSGEHETSEECDAEIAMLEEMAESVVAILADGDPEAIEQLDDDLSAEEDARLSIHFPDIYDDFSEEEEE